MPQGGTKKLLDATLDATDIVLVSPVYWYSAPAAVKAYIDHWSAWLRVPGVGFKESMALKRLWVISTSGDCAKAQPMIDSYRLCAEFLGMQWKGALWGKGGAPDAVLSDLEALRAADGFFNN
jgi:putative NADPH-quinone reductase